MKALLLPCVRIMAQAIKAHAAVTIQRGKRITAVSILLSPRDQCTRIIPAVTSAIWDISRVVRMASPCACPPNMPRNIRAAIVKSDARKNTERLRRIDVRPHADELTEE